MSLQTPATEDVAPSLAESYTGSFAPGEEVILVDSGVMLVVQIGPAFPPAGDRHGPLEGTVIEVNPLTSPTRETDYEEGDNIQFEASHIHGVR